MKEYGVGMTCNFCDETTLVYYSETKNKKSRLRGSFFAREIFQFLEAIFQLALLQIIKRNLVMPVHCSNVLNIKELIQIIQTE